MSDISLTDPLLSPEDRRGLHYPFGRFTPESGGFFEVAPGVLWLRMAIPFALDHINLWVLDDGDGWVIVDTGVSTPQGRAIWEAAFAGPLRGKPVKRVIVTHYHPDHIGLAGWLCAHWGVPLETSRGEFMLARMLMLDAQPRPPADVLDFFRRTGWSASHLESFAQHSWGNFGAGVSTLPSGFRRLQDGDSFKIGGRDWRIVTGRGHSPEHCCLVCDEAGLMIAGDQVLPRITSNISVYPTEPRADPLADWFASLDKLAGLSADLRVLPAHNEPFDGLHTRLTQLRDDHDRKLDALAAFCAQPRTTFETFVVLFSRPVDERQVMMATGEALAHLHRLENDGIVQRLADKDADRFVAA